MAPGMIRTDSQVLASEIKGWAESLMKSSPNVTGIAIARLVRNAAVPGRVNQGSEDALKECLRIQHSVWHVVILIDTLITTMVLPLMVFEEVVPAESLDPGTADALMFSYYALVSFCFYITTFHIACCTTLYIGSSYIIDFDDILWFYMNFHNWIALFNVLLVPICLCMLTAAALGHVLKVGPLIALPAIVCATLFIPAFAGFYLCIFKPRFSKRFRSVLSDDPDARNLTPNIRAGSRANSKSATVGIAYVPE